MNQSKTFINFDKYSRIQLDELVRSRVTISSGPVPVYNDKEYSLVVIPDVSRTGRRKPMFK
ncbi:MAG: hypothetical protein ACOX7R_00345 [Acetivibrionales bacterium]